MLAANLLFLMHGNRTTGNRTKGETMLDRWVIYEENMDGNPRFVAIVDEKDDAIAVINILNLSSAETYMITSECAWDSING